MKALDQQGFPVTLQKDKSIDGGDTAAIVGTVITLETNTLISAAFLWMANSLMIGGIPRRHWDTSKWPGQPDRFSRDQLIPMICAAIRYSKDSLFEKYYEAHKKRYFLTAWNTKKNGALYVADKFPDLTGPDVWALWIRYARPRWGCLALWALDISLLLGAIHWRYFRHDRVCRNHMLSLITCRRFFPTIVSRAAFALADFPDLVKRWRDHCEAVGEYQTADLFEMETILIKIYKR